MAGDAASEAEPTLAAPAGFWGVEPRKAEDGSPDINFRVLQPNAPTDQRNLKNEVERALTVVKALYRRPEDARKLEESVAKLLALSQVGLVGSNANTAVALDALHALEADIVERESGPVKNQYMRKLGIWAAAFGAVAFAFFFFCRLYPDYVLNEVYRYRNLFLVWAGCMGGAWASFASRKVILKFSDLVALEEDRIEPQLRLIFTGFLTIIIALIFVTGVADIEIGQFRASTLIHSGSIALLLGAFAGLAEKTLPSAVMSRASTVITAAQST